MRAFYFSAKKSSFIPIDWALRASMKPPRIGATLFKLSPNFIL
jgi:hypothetical protein